MADLSKKLFYSIGGSILVIGAVIAAMSFGTPAAAKPKPPLDPVPPVPPNPGPAPPQLPGVVERPGYVITPNCGGVNVVSGEIAYSYARTVAQKYSQEYATVPAALSQAEAEYYGGCTWTAIRDVAPIFWYRMRIGFFRGAVDVGLMTEADAQTQINNMRASPPQGIDPSMMTPFNIWGDQGEQP